MVTSNELLLNYNVYYSISNLSLVMSINTIKSKSHHKMNKGFFLGQNVCYKKGRTHMINDLDHNGEEETSLKGLLEGIVGYL